jgi:transposase InsO family protein
MNNKLHVCARTTPAVRREIAMPDEPVAVLAQRFGVSHMTIRKWRQRSDFLDRPHTAHRLPTTMTAAQEAIAVQRRRTLLLPLDDLLSVMREFVCPQLSRSALDRCLRRHGVINLKALSKSCPIKIRKILTDNGKAFTDRLLRQAARSERGGHEFDQLCQALVIEHRLTRPRRPKTHGMVERFNGRIEEVLRRHRFRSGEDLQSTLMRYVWLYNHHLPQAALKGRTPIQTMQHWYQEHPDLFHKQPYDRPEPVI